MINLIFAYLIFKVLTDKKDLVSEIYICPDHRPSKEVHHYIQKLATYFGYNNLTKEKNLKFIDRNKYDVKKNIPAHKIALKILRGKRKSNVIVDFEEINNLISKLL